MQKNPASAESPVAQEEHRNVGKVCKNGNERENDKQRTDSGEGHRILNHILALGQQDIDSECALQDGQDSRANRCGRGLPAEGEQDGVEEGEMGDAACPVAGERRDIKQ